MPVLRWPPPIINASWRQRTREPRDAAATTTVEAGNSRVQVLVSRLHGFTALHLHIGGLSRAIMFIHPCSSLFISGCSINTTTQHIPVVIPHQDPAHLRNNRTHRLLSLCPSHPPLCSKSYGHIVCSEHAPKTMAKLAACRLLPTLSLAPPPHFDLPCTPQLRSLSTPPPPLLLLHSSSSLSSPYPLLILLLLFLLFLLFLLHTRQSSIPFHPSLPCSPPTTLYPSANQFNSSIRHFPSFHPSTPSTLTYHFNTTLARPLSGFPFKSTRAASLPAVLPSSSPFVINPQVAITNTHPLPSFPSAVPGHRGIHVSLPDVVLYPPVLFLPDHSTCYTHFGSRDLFTGCRGVM
ncbi:hypothetical protein BGZ61DRAFT_553027 [Ilyonectria robusta]|uniref:uncharacterized protein n=1 Tax=Ilyonectria robusta TaxID=1079257 RepID=UPI001E8D89AE|nr:uncharacterized protein BGZ61DRAFT_553027 [Ilyonectria robusta]KAH8735537.1 hypothetical protein BGZ61DRAFT_553027 [Ilyonectria robusta]